MTTEVPGGEGPPSTDDAYGRGGGGRVFRRTGRLHGARGVDSELMTDRDLLHALRSGPTPTGEVYAWLLDAYGEELYRHCLRNLGDRDAAHVVLRDTLIVARAHSVRLVDDGRLGEWLHALAETECERHRDCVWGDRPPEHTVSSRGDDLVRVLVLNGMNGPELDGYRAHVAVRAGRFDDQGFPLGPGPCDVLARTSVSVFVPLVLMLSGALLVLFLTGAD